MHVSSHQASCHKPQRTRSHVVPAAQPQLGTAGSLISRPMQGVSSVRGATKHLFSAALHGLETN